MASKLDIVKKHIFKYHNRYLFLLFIIACVAVPYMRYKSILTTPETINAAGHSLVIIAILFSGFQFRANHDWNRRQLAIKEAKNVKISLRDSIEIIDKKFNYTNRRRHEKIAVEIIHKAICVLNSDGECKFFNGKLRIDHDGDGGKVDSALTSVLNNFEYLATGVEQCVFDEEIIYKLYGGPLLRVAAIFDDYITHINVDMYPGRQGKIYENLRSVASRFEDREKNNTEKSRAETG
ncbi:DUF4760 domain-containing protein [Desulforhopalus singaporensis]|uniref:Uncharacterized protein n=1 Tax=Desulforhopalus singaporensis TaxID=91360 RepID=A0A1H0RI67_9BACT|nr:DUF4760 domain-containing protein [Desulforhopalus singaporensis]SDP29262.1 protein of unknown function [Desulforhopalus singaporensis]